MCRSGVGEKKADGMGMDREGERGKNGSGSVIQPDETAECRSQAEKESGAGEGKKEGGEVNLAGGIALRIEGNRSTGQLTNGPQDPTADHLSAGCALPVETCHTDLLVSTTS